jgi:hypothetical protein
MGHYNSMTQESKSAVAGDEKEIKQQSPAEVTTWTKPESGWLTDPPQGK